MQNKEAPDERFRRVATLRTNGILKKLRILGNCANRHVYKYTEKEVEKIFSVIEKQLKETKGKFHFAKNEDFKL